MNYSKICSSLLEKMPPRPKEVVGRRFGIGGFNKRETLEAIGKEHGITRERVRQIEREGIIQAKKQNIEKVSDYFKKVVSDFGGLKREALLISSLGNEKDKNNIFFLLTLNDNLKRNVEDKNFHTFWSKEDSKLKELVKITDNAISFLEKEKEPLFIEELYKKMKPKKTILPFFLSCIEISKQIEKNPEGKIGLKDWLEINPRGVKDRAYLILRRTNKPLHFREVASLIKNSSLFSSGGAHTATVHNELIKDKRFVLVGRGFYALSEWGYEPGVVKDIISKVLIEAEKPLSRNDILEKVLKKRIVKEHTVLLNLQDKNRFLKDDEGKYTIKEA